MSQFIGYHLDDTWDGTRAIPISTGQTHEEAQSLAITRTLSACVLHGGVQVQQRDEVDPETFASLKKLLDEFFQSKGIA